jgi:hypothetical protein
VGHAVTIKSGVVEGEAVDVWEAEGNIVTKNIGVDVAEAVPVLVFVGVCVGVGVTVAETDAVSSPTVNDTPHACGVVIVP